MQSVKEGFLEEGTLKLGLERPNGGGNGKEQWVWWQREGKAVSGKNQEAAGWAPGGCSGDGVNLGAWNLPPGIPLPESRRGDCLVCKWDWGRGRGPGQTHRSPFSSSHSEPSAPIWAALKGRAVEEVLRF